MAKMRRADSPPAGHCRAALTAGRYSKVAKIIFGMPYRTDRRGESKVAERMYT
jgi:hypothetical protein